MVKPSISLNEQEFILGLLHEESTRQDKRGFYEFRDLSIEFGESLGSVEVRLGKTRLVVKVSAEVVKPYEERPLEGLFLITTNISSMASPHFENNRTNEDELMLTRLIEKAIRLSNALDLESLCIIAGKSCWMIRTDVHYLDYDGNFVDATCLGVVAALLHFRKPDVSVEGDQAIIHDVNERVPVPLSVLHAPICVTFSFFKPKQNHNASESDAMSEEVFLIDATAKEEALRDSEMTITVNKNREVCQLSKPGGVPVEALTLLNCCNLAYQKAVDLTNFIYKRLKEDDAIRNKGNQELSAENDRS